ALAQFAIVPVLDTHESQRTQGLRGSDAASPGAGILEAALQVQADLLDQIGVLTEECVDASQHGIEMDAQSTQCQIAEPELGTEGAAGAMGNGAVEQGAAKDLGSGGEGCSELGTGFGNCFLLHL